MDLSRKSHLTASIRFPQNAPLLELIRKGQAGATITVPSDGSHDGAAADLVRAVRDRFHVELPVVPGERALKGLSTPHAIALGCLADNPHIEALTFRTNVLVDRWYPGRGGWVNQMIPSPFTHGNHVLLLGGSDPEGVRTAVDRFIDTLSESDGGRIPWRLDVQLGNDHLPLPEDRMDCLGTSASEVFTPHDVLPETPYTAGFRGGSARNHLLRLGMYGPHADNYHLSRSSQLGLRYLYTGCPEDAAMYRQTLLDEAACGVIEKLYHYKSARMFQLWAVLAGSPIFASEDRETVTRAIANYLLEESGIANRDDIRDASIRTEIFNRHTACDALNLWIGADWLWRETGDPAFLEYRTDADTYFLAQAGTDVPLTGLTEGYGSYLEVYLEWMLLSCPNRIADDPDIRQWALRVAGLCTNGGQLVLGPQTDGGRYPYHLLRRLAYLLKDGRYLFVSDLRERQVNAGVDRVVQFSAGQAYAGDVAPREPETWTGLTVYPMNERLRRWKATSIPSGKGFDRAVGRSGWNTQDDYLMIVGVRSGGKSLPNVGTVAAYERFGHRLITSESVPLFPGSANPWHHSTVTVNCAGIGAGVAEGARLLACRNDEEGGGHLLRYRVTSDGFGSWTRSIHWKPSEYVLVIDRVSVESDEPFTLGVNWRCGGPATTVTENLAAMDFAHPQVRLFVQTSGGLDLSSETSAYPAVGSPPGSPPTMEHLLHATMDSAGGDSEVEVATLMHAVADSEQARYHLHSSDTEWIVESDGTPCRFSRKKSDRQQRQTVGTLNHSNAAQRLTSRWSRDLHGRLSAWAQAEDGSGLAIGTEHGTVLVLNGEGRPEWTANADTEITAVVFAGRDVLVGTRSGKVVRFDADGGQRWDHACTFREERSFWPWWFLETPAIGAIAVGRDPETDRETVAVGTGSCSLNFLDARTGSLMGDIVSRYGFPDQIVPHLTESSGKLQFLVGHRWLTSGSVVRAWQPPPEMTETIPFWKSIAPAGRTTGEWDTCGCQQFWAGTLVEGMPGRVVVLRHGAVNQVTVYAEATGEPLWDATLGEVPVAMAVTPAGSTASARIHVAGKFGWLVGLDAEGHRVTAERKASSLRGVHAGRNGRLAFWDRSALHVARGDGDPNLQSADRYEIAGDPLGWYASPAGSGLLCVRDRQVVFNEAPGWTP